MSVPVRLNLVPAASVLFALMLPLRRGVAQASSAASEIHGAEAGSVSIGGSAVAANATVQSFVSSSRPESPVAVVEQLYRDYSWELVFFPPPDDWNVITNEPRQVLAKYFDDSLTSLIVADEACAAREGKCNIDGSPIWDSNDPEASELVVAATNDPATVLVTFRRGYPPPQGAMVKIFYKMVRTSNGWRIRDIVQEDGWSFVAQLKRK